MADFVYGDLHSLMRDQIMQERIRKRALKDVEKEVEAYTNVENPDKNGWTVEDEPIVI